MSRTVQNYLSLLITIVVVQSALLETSFADKPDTSACGAMMLKSLTEWQNNYPFVRAACHLTLFPSTQPVGTTRPSTDPAQQSREGISISEMGQTLTFPLSVQSLELRAVNGISLQLDHSTLSGSWHIPGDGDQLRTQLSHLHEKKDSN